MPWAWFYRFLIVLRALWLPPLSCSPAMAAYELMPIEFLVPNWLACCEFWMDITVWLPKPIWGSLMLPLFKSFWFCEPWFSNPVLWVDPCWFAICSWDCCLAYFDMAIYNFLSDLMSNPNCWSNSTVWFRFGSANEPLELMKWVLCILFLVLRVCLNWVAWDYWSRSSPCLRF